jgi:hypothetical protein
VWVVFIFGSYQTFAFWLVQYALGVTIPGITGLLYFGIVLLFYPIFLFYNDSISLFLRTNLGRLVWLSISTAFGILAMILQILIQSRFY